MIQQPAKKLNYYERESISNSITEIKLIKLGRDFGFWDYYDKMLFTKECQENIEKMLLGKPAKYIINHAGPHFYE